MTDDPRHDESYLVSLMRLVRARWPVVALCVAVATAAALAGSLMQQREYSAEASLLFRDPGFDQKIFGGTVVQPTEDPTRQAATNAKLVSLGVIAERTSRAMGGSPSARDLSDSVEVTPGDKADVVTVTATAANRELAATIANTFASEYISFRRETDRALIRQAQRLVDRQIAALDTTDLRSPRGEKLAERSEQLGVMAALQTGKAELVQRAQPPVAASSPKPARDTLLGLLLGLALGIGLAGLLERFDRRLRDEDEIQEAYGRPVLGSVPQSDAIAGAGGTHELTRADAEAFRSLRTNLRYFNVRRRIRSIAVTSAMPGEGKTTVAWNLALASAVGGQRTLLIEADLRRPGFAQRLDGRAKTGLSTMLAVEMPLEEVAQEVQPDYEYEVADFGLSVVTAGPLPPNPAELLETDRMKAIIDEAQARYDFVVVDTPPLTIVPDATPIMRHVSGTILVARLGTTTRDAAKQLRHQVDHLDAPVLGVVVNSVDGGEGDYYGYAHERDLAMGGGVRVRIPA